MSHGPEDALAAFIRKALKVEQAAETQLAQAAAEAQLAQAAAEAQLAQLAQEAAALAQTAVPAAQPPSLRRSGRLVKKADVYAPAAWDKKKKMPGKGSQPLKKKKKEEPGKGSQPPRKKPGKKRRRRAEYEVKHIADLDLLFKVRWAGYRAAEDTEERTESFTGNICDLPASKKALNAAEQLCSMLQRWVRKQKRECAA